MQQLPKSLCLINDPRRKQKCVANVANSQNCFLTRSQYVCGASVEGCVELPSSFASLHPETVPPGWVQEWEEELNRLEIHIRAASHSTQTVILRCIYGRRRDAGGFAVH